MTSMRYLEEKVVWILMIFALLVVLGFLGLIIAVTVIRGGGVILKNPLVIVTPPGPRYLLGGQGGFLHAILGSVYLTLPATAIASFLAVGIAVFLQSDYSSVWVAETIRATMDILWGTPSIVYGIFILAILMSVQARGCLLAGICALTLLELPIITRYADEAIQAVPIELKEATYSMGTTRWEVAKVVTKYSLPGVIAGMLIGAGRGIGDAASVIFTAGAGNSMPGGLMESVTALPILIFQQASSFYPSVREHAYAAAFVLMVIIILLNITSRFVVRHFSKYRPGGS